MKGTQDDRFVRLTRDYVGVMRPDHWFKNVFMLPGVVIGLVLTHTSPALVWWRLLVGVASTCLIASANYVINEWLDADSDRFHPVKRQRPSVSGRLKARWIYSEYAILALVGLGMASTISVPFLVTSAILLVMGVLYNVRPFRTKDRPYVDVLSESINNPIRLLLGWFIVTDRYLLPSGLIFGYWMGGAYLMGLKRFAELRFLGTREAAALYRRSFRYYTEENLLISSFFYGMCSALFIGTFLVKYRIELVLMLPLLGILFAWYMKISMKADLPAQMPERLYRERAFFGFVLCFAVVCTLLLFVDIPEVHVLLSNSLLPVP